MRQDCRLACPKQSTSRTFADLVNHFIVRANLHAGINWRSGARRPVAATHPSASSRCLLSRHLFHCGNGGREGGEVLANVAARSHQAFVQAENSQSLFST